MERLTKAPRTNSSNRLFWFREGSEAPLQSFSLQKIHFERHILQLKSLDINANESWRNYANTVRPMTWSSQTLSGAIFHYNCSYERLFIHCPCRKIIASRHNQSRLRSSSPSWPPIQSRLQAFDTGLRLLISNDLLSACHRNRTAIVRPQILNRSLVNMVINANSTATGPDGSTCHHDRRSSRACRPLKSTTNRVTAWSVLLIDCSSTR